MANRARVYWTEFESQGTPAVTFAKTVGVTSPASSGSTFSKNVIRSNGITSPASSSSTFSKNVIRSGGITSPASSGVTFTKYVIRSGGVVSPLSSGSVFSKFVIRGFGAASPSSLGAARVTRFPRAGGIVSALSAAVRVLTRVRVYWAEFQAVGLPVFIYNKNIGLSSTGSLGGIGNVPFAQKNIGISTITRTGASRSVTIPGPWTEIDSFELVVQPIKTNGLRSSGTFSAASRRTVVTKTCGVTSAASSGSSQRSLVTRGIGLISQGAVSLSARLVAPRALGVTSTAQIGAQKFVGVSKTSGMASVGFLTLDQLHLLNQEKSASIVSRPRVTLNKQAIFTKFCGISSSTSMGGTAIKFVGGTSGIRTVTSLGATEIKFIPRSSGLASALVFSEAVSKLFPRSVGLESPFTLSVTQFLPYRVVFIGVESETSFGGPALKRTPKRFAIISALVLGERPTVKIKAAASVGFDVRVLYFIVNDHPHEHYLISAMNEKPALTSARSVDPDARLIGAKV